MRKKMERLEKKVRKIDVCYFSVEIELVREWKNVCEENKK